MCLRAADVKLYLGGVLLILLCVSLQEKNLGFFSVLCTGIPVTFEHRECRVIVLGIKAKHM